VREEALRESSFMESQSVNDVSEDSSEEGDEDPREVLLSDAHSTALSAMPSLSTMQAQLSSVEEQAKLEASELSRKRDAYREMDTSLKEVRRTISEGRGDADYESAAYGIWIKELESKLKESVAQNDAARKKYEDCHDALEKMQKELVDVKHENSVLKKEMLRRDVDVVKMKRAVAETKQFKSALEKAERHINVIEAENVRLEALTQTSGVGDTSAESEANRLRKEVRATEEARALLESQMKNLNAELLERTDEVYRITRLTSLLRHFRLFFFKFWFK